MRDSDLYNTLRQHSQGLFTDYPILLIFENQEQMDYGQIRKIELLNKSHFICVLKEEITEDLLMRLKYSTHMLV